MYISFLDALSCPARGTVHGSRWLAVALSIHIGANLIPDSVFKPMSKNQNDDNDYLRLFSIVFFAVESDSGVKWSLKLVQGPKKEDLEA